MCAKVVPNLHYREDIFHLSWRSGIRETWFNIWHWTRKLSWSAAFLIVHTAIRQYQKTSISIAMPMLYISLESNDADALSSFTTWLSAVNDWMSTNFLKLNEVQTEILLVGSKAEREEHSSWLGNFNPCIIPPTKPTNQTLVTGKIKLNSGWKRCVWMADLYLWSFCHQWKPEWSLY